jgi:hypothetical protein
MKKRFLAKMYILGLFLFTFSACQNQAKNRTISQDTVHEKQVSKTMGWAANTKGGKDGRIIKVTNLNKDGAGSLKEAFEVDEPRIIVFEVGGVIDLEGSVLSLKKPFVTVMGQTAPDPGITIIKGGVSIRAHEVIIRHIRIRPGENKQPKQSGWEVDGLNTSSAYNVVVDHCSFSWATDENLSVSGPRFEGENLEEWRKNTSHTVTFSYNLIAEALSNSTHSKGEHSKGSLIHDNVTEVALIANIYASNLDRNPLFKGGAQGVIVNNYIFNPVRAAIDYGLVKGQWKGRTLSPGKMTIIGNILEKGMDSHQNMPFAHFMGPVEVYFKKNVVYGSELGKNKLLVGDHTEVNEPPVWTENIEVLPTDKLKEHLFKNVGARPWNRDTVDKRIISEIKAGTHRIIDSEEEVGGYPLIERTYKEFDAAEWDLN